MKYALVISGDFDEATTADPLLMTKGNTCPEQCNHRGKCVKGQCKCDS